MGTASNKVRQAGAKGFIDRRSFLKGAAVTASTAAAMGIVGCAPASRTESSQPEGAAYAEPASSRPSFMIAPDPIADSDIAETVESDVVVIGAGPSGLMTALACAEQGLSVTLFAESAHPVARGGSNGAVYSKRMAEEGIERVDADPFLRTQLTEASFNVDIKKWYKYYNNSEEAMDWLIDTMADVEGAICTLEQGNSDVDPTDPSYAPNGSHCWNNDEYPVVADGQPIVVNALADKIIAHGGRIDYEVNACQLVRGDDNRSGRVTAVVGQRKSDEVYIKYVGRKAVVMACGDFSGDKEMMEAYAPHGVDMVTNFNMEMNPNEGKVYGGLYTGQGQKMGLWVGAAWQKTYPNAIMSFTGIGGPSNQPYNAHSGLLVDGHGERFCNELIGIGYLTWAVRHLKDQTCYAIIDNGFPDAMQPWHNSKQALGTGDSTPDEVRAKWDEAVSEGKMFKAETLEDLILQMDLPMAETLATIEEYNGFCDAGADAQFHKKPELLVAVRNAPFYGWKSSAPRFLTVLGGLRTNINMQVCDERDEAIPGLYNVGTMVGDFFANVYNFLIEGHNHGANCLTFGYLTARYIAENE